MPVYVHQTFEIKQEKFKEAIENLQEIKKYRNDHYDHSVEVLLPISGQDYTYGILATYENLAEMEVQNRKMYDDDEYLKLIGDLFLEQVVQGTMNTQIYRGINKKVASKEDKEK
ncbi:NIPSNAP protein OS=Ureibacillus acetophenoni OX=614649 GN=SAMN05877842_106147 PE=4 SV=1 [Ureibacillus acetophenoni]